MLTISGIVSTVSVVLILIVSAVYVKQRYDTIHDYNTKIGDLTKNVNDTNKSAVQFDEKQQQNITNIENDVTDVRKTYVSKNDMQKEVKTVNLQANTGIITSLESNKGKISDFDADVVRTRNLYAPSAFVKNFEGDNAKLKSGIQIQDQGPLIETSRNANERYGISQNNTNTTVYAADIPGSKVNIAMRDNKGSFANVASFGNDDAGKRIDLDGRVILNNKLSLQDIDTDDGSSVLMVGNAQGDDLAEGVVMKNLAVTESAFIGNTMMAQNGNISFGTNLFLDKAAFLDDVYADNIKSGKISLTDPKNRPVSMENKGGSLATYLAPGGKTCIIMEKLSIHLMHKETQITLVA